MKLQLKILRFLEVKRIYLYGVSPKEMNEEYKILFNKVFKAFTTKYTFNFGAILS